MKVTIENVTATEQRENNEIINRCLKAIEGITTIEDAMVSIEERIGNVCFWKFGRGGNHIWVSNWKNERLMLITN